MTPDPLDRLPDALHRSVPAAVRAEQREELMAAMAASSGRTSLPGSSWAFRALPGSSWAFRRVRTVGLAGALLLIPSAAAAQSSAPGDLLYPLKQASEQVQVIFDEDAPARHRIEEIITLLDRDADTGDIVEAVNDATNAVAGTDNEELEQHLAEVRAEVRERRPEAVPDHAGAPGEPATPDRPGRPEDPGSQGRENRPDDPGSQGDDGPGRSDETDVSGDTEDDGDDETADDADEPQGGRPSEAGESGTHSDPPTNDRGGRADDVDEARDPQDRPSAHDEDDEDDDVDGVLRGRGFEA